MHGDQTLALGLDVPRQLLCPLDREHAVSSDLVEAEIEHLARIVEAIEIDVEQRQAAAAIFLDERERRAAHLVRRDAEALREPLHERRLPCAEIAVEQHDVARPERAGETATYVSGLRFAGRCHCRHSDMVPRGLARPTRPASPARPAWPTLDGCERLTSPSRCWWPAPRSRRRARRRRRPPLRRWLNASRTPASSRSRRPASTRSMRGSSSSPTGSPRP